jgi:molecular chaperone DnaK
MTKLIEANTTIPASQSEVFSTASDNQSSVEIHVLQGERPMANQNKSIGKFHFDEIPPLRRGIPKIEVIFDIDADGILNVTAVNQLTEKTSLIRIEASSGLSNEEINRMKDDAIKYAAEDQEMKVRAIVSNKADTQILQTEIRLQEFADILPEEKNKAILKALEELKFVYRTQNFNDMDKAMANLSAACLAVGKIDKGLSKDEIQSAFGSEA